MIFGWGYESCAESVARGRQRVDAGTFPLGGDPATRFGLAELDPTTGALLPWAPVFEFPVVEREPALDQRDAAVAHVVARDGALVLVVVWLNEVWA